jgi:lycopene cyclase domain-containing protein
MFLYLTILLSAIFVPFVFSFDSKLQFWKQWKYLFAAIGIVTPFYIISDIILTGNGIWGFNSKFHVNFNIIGLPLEEWLFFIIIPYASVFLHDVFVFYFPKAKLGLKTTTIISTGLIAGSIFIILLNLSRTYTIYIFTTVFVAVVIVLILNIHLLSRYLLSFLLIFVPFILVNSVLTGTFIDEPVFWYNPDAILGIRIITIPIEDAGFSFSMLLMVVFVRDWLQRKR